MELRRFLSRVCFYPLCACTMLGAAFLGFRFSFTGQVTHGYFVWNTILAWIPYVCSLGLLWLYERGASAPLRWMRWLLAAMWLAFFPNAPYLVTDLLHFDQSRSFAPWYDVGLMLTFAWTGCFLAIVSLHIVQQIVRAARGAVVSWAFAGATIALSGLGIYMGRFVRLNSWDLLTRPGDIARMMIHGLINLAHHPRTIGVTLMFSTFLFVCYLTWTSSRLTVQPPAATAKDRC